MLRWIRLVQRRTDNGDGVSTSFDRRLVSVEVHAFGKTGDDHEAFPHELTSQLPCTSCTFVGHLTRANDRHALSLREAALSDAVDPARVARQPLELRLWDRA